MIRLKNFPLKLLFLILVIKMILVILHLPLLLMFQSVDSVKHAIPVYCSSHVSYIQSDPTTNKLLPYMFKIHRCGGSEENPAYKKCVPTSDGVQTVPLKLLAADQGKMETITYENHTKCELVCVTNANTCSPQENYDEGRCACDCRYTEGTDTSRVCRSPFQFKRTSGNCDCVCPDFIRNAACGLNKVFSEEDCGCVCKRKFFKRCARKKMVIDETCNCVDLPTNDKTIGGENCKGGVTGGVLAFIVIFEAICFVGGYYLFYVYCYKRQYKPYHKEMRQKTLDIDTLDNGNQVPLLQKQHSDSDPDDRRHNEIEEAVARLEESQKDSQRNRKYEEAVARFGDSQRDSKGSGKYSTQDNLNEKYTNSVSYYPDDEKSPMTPKINNSEIFMYNDILETEDDMQNLPSLSTDTYSLSEYDGSVTQV